MLSPTKMISGTEYVIASGAVAAVNFRLYQAMAPIKKIKHGGRIAAAKLMQVDAPTNKTGMVMDQIFWQIY